MHACVCMLVMRPPVCTRTHTHNHTDCAMPTLDDKDQVVGYVLRELKTGNYVRTYLTLNFETHSLLGYSENPEVSTACIVVYNGMYIHVHVQCATCMPYNYYMGQQRLLSSHKTIGQF